MDSPPPITPLQKLLRDQVLPHSEIRHATGRSRATIWRWARGLSHPDRVDADALIALFSRHGHELDYNGCYASTVEVSDAE